MEPTGCLVEHSGIDRREEITLGKYCRLKWLRAYDSVIFTGYVKLAGTDRVLKTVFGYWYDISIGHLLRSSNTGTLWHFRNMWILGHSGPDLAIVLSESRFAMGNNTTITNWSCNQTGDTTISVEDTIDGNTAYSSVRYFTNGDGDRCVTHTVATNGIIVSSGQGHPETGPLTAAGIENAKYWKRNIVTRIYH